MQKRWFYVLEGNPASKKNSQQILINKLTGRPFVAPSKIYKEYERDSLREMMWWNLPEKPIDFPVNVKAIFYRADRRRCDLVNLQEALLDVLVKGKLLADDNYNIVASMDGCMVLYDKRFPRTEIIIERIG